MWILLFAIALEAAAGPVTLPLRTRVQPYKGVDEWRETTVAEPLDPPRTALILCDLWDKHWCSGATARVNVLAPKADRVAKAARTRGVLIIHAPSNTMEFYASHPARLAVRQLERAAPPTPLDLTAPPLPIDDSDGGCDTGERSHKAWTRQHPAIAVEPQDLITDTGEDVYSALKSRGIRHLLIAGVHTNMCILNRTFAIKQMSKWGVRVILLRDLTDAMYDPNDRPYVPHDRGTELVIEHIEKHWAPTALSSDLLRALQ